MDIPNLDEVIKKLSFSCQTLNLDERFQLKLRLMKLKEEQCLDDIQFWGKIIGMLHHQASRRTITLLLATSTLPSLSSRSRNSISLQMIISL